MNKRQKNKMIKNKVTLFALKNELFKELKQDSVAHLIKDYFTMDNIRNKEMFKPENGKIIEIKKKKGKKNYLEEIKKFREHYKIETDDTITIVDMYFANEFSKDYIGKGIFDEGE